MYVCILTSQNIIRAQVCDTSGFIFVKKMSKRLPQPRLFFVQQAAQLINAKSITTLARAIQP
jgi:hypothetical protein